MVGIFIYSIGNLEHLEVLCDSIESNTIVEHKKVIILDNVPEDIDLSNFTDCEIVRVSEGDRQLSFNKATEIIGCDVLCFMQENCEVLTPSWLETMLQSLTAENIVAPMLYTPNKEVNDFWQAMISLWDDEENSESEEAFMQGSTRIYPLGILVMANTWNNNIGKWDTESKPSDFTTMDLVKEKGIVVEKIKEVKISIDKVAMDRKWQN